MPTIDAVEETVELTDPLADEAIDAVDVALRQFVAVALLLAVCDADPEVVAVADSTGVTDALLVRLETLLGEEAPEVVALVEPVTVDDSVGAASVTVALAVLRAVTDGEPEGDGDGEDDVARLSVLASLAEAVAE